MKPHFQAVTFIVDTNVVHLLLSRCFINVIPEYFLLNDGPNPISRR